MTVWYLDNDDEITDAVARLRNADDERVVFVVPPGSRIATGRINFKLLAREAQTRELAMAIASPDEQVRSLAAAAGVLTATTPDEAEAALERGDEPPEATTPVTPDTDSPVASKPASGVGLFSWRSQRMRLATVVVLVIVLVGGFVAMQTLPTAEITLIPRLATLGPLAGTIDATTDVQEVDAPAGLVPAVALIIPLTTQDAYEASGVRTTEAAATGEVVFSSATQEFDQEIAAGTRVQTAAGTAFGTTESVVLPRSDSGEVSEVVAPVEALRGGEVGNVPAEAISSVPSLASQGISVTNPEATAGGRLDSTPQVEPGDYDAAAVDLRNRLAGELAAYLRDPANVPEGLTVFAETALLGTVALEPAADALVGTGQGRFDLTGTAAAQVLAVDEAGIDEVTRTRLLTAVPESAAIVPGSIVIEHGEGIVDGDRIVFDGSAVARTRPLIDSEALVDQVAGLPVSDARAILEGLGAATVNVWPEFLSGLPNDRQRITLDVIEASDTE